MKMEYMSASDANILIASNEVLQGKEVKVAGDVDTFVNNASFGILGVRSSLSKQIV